MRSHLRTRAIEAINGTPALARVLAILATAAPKGKGDYVTADLFTLFGIKPITWRCNYAPILFDHMISNPRANKHPVKRTPLIKKLNFPEGHPFNYRNRAFYQLEWGILIDQLKELICQDIVHCKESMDKEIDGAKDFVDKLSKRTKKYTNAPMKVQHTIERKRNKIFLFTSKTIVNARWVFNKESRRILSEIERYFNNVENRETFATCLSDYLRYCLHSGHIKCSFIDLVRKFLLLSALKGDKIPFARDYIAWFSLDVSGFLQIYYGWMHKDFLEQEEKELERISNGGF